MGTAGAYAGQSFSFNYSFVDSASPETFFASDLANADITVYSRSGSSTGAGASIATTPVRSGSLFTITLTTSEMTGDEVILQCSKTGMIPETISITLEPTPADVSEVKTSPVTGVNDFKADTTSLATQASVDSIDTDVQNIGSDVTAVLTDTNELQTNQNNWLTATGFSTHSASDVVTSMQAVANDFKATGFATVNPDNASITAILADTNELQLNQNNWLTATGFSTHSASDVVTSMQAVAGDFKADVSGLSTFNSTTDTVTVGTNNDKTGYVLTQAFPSNFSTLIIGTGADAGKVTTSNPASGGGSAHTAQDVADLILVTPANKLATDASGNVEANNMRGTDGANTTAPDNASIASILADTNELQLNQGDWATATGFSTHSATDVRNSLQAVADDFKADVSSLASQSSVTTVDSVVDAIKVKTDQLTFTNPGEVDANAVSGGGGGGATAAEVYTYFTDGTREDAFKADVSSLATSAQVTALNDFDPTSQDVTISTAQAQAIADEVLKRGVGNTQDSADAHSLAAIVLGILESQRTGASWTIRKTDGSTFTTKTLSLDSGANPVTGVT